VELEAELRAGRVTLRALMIWCSARGEPAEAIAEWLDCHPRTVRRWIHSFAAGMAGLADGPRAGRPRLVAKGDPEARQRWAAGSGSGS